jgi:hypothetical protein
MSAAYRINNIADAKRESARLKQELDDTYIRYTTALIDIPINFQGDIHRYICIRLSGYLEQLIYVSLTGYIKSNHNPKVSSFALKHFKYAPNMKPRNFEQLIAKFGDDWSIDLTQFLDDANRRDLMSSLLEIRNTTAHGGNYRGSSLQVSSYKQLIDDTHRWVLTHILI